MSHDHASHEHEGVGHISPIWQLILVLIVLLILTAITVMITWVDMGAMNIWAALLIAFVKGSLVVLYFMHLRYDAPFNAMVFILALLFTALFISFSLIDTGEYHETLTPPRLEATVSG